MGESREKIEKRGVTEIDGGDRDIRPATKSDMGRFGSSFSLAYIKTTPFSRGIRIFRSPGMNSFLYK